MRQIQTARFWTFVWLITVGVLAMANAQPRTMVYVSNAVDQSITVAELDTATGGIAIRQSVPVGGTVMPMALSPDGKFLFAALRSPPYAVASFAIDPHHGRLTPVGQFALPDSMASLSVDRSGRMLLAASYGGNRLSVSRITAAGEVLAPHQILATPAKPHTLQVSLDNRFAFATSLGAHELLQFKVDPDLLTLQRNSAGSVTVPAMSGPRHMAFHPAGKWVFVVGELDAKVHTFELDGQQGRLRWLASHSSLPSSFLGVPSGADIHLTPAGDVLLTSDRGSNTLTSFKVDPLSGHLSKVGHYPSEDQPRGFNIDPSGQYVLEVGQRSGMLSVHVIQENGQLQKRGRWPVGAGPNWVETLRLKN